MKTKIKILHIAYCNSAKQVWISTVLVHVISSIANPVTNQIAMLSSSFAELGPAQPQLVFLHFSTKNSTFTYFQHSLLKVKLYIGGIFQRQLTTFLISLILRRLMRKVVYCLWNMPPINFKYFSYLIWGENLSKYKIFEIS